MKSKKWILIVSVLLIAAGVLYFFVFRLTKSKAIKIITEAGNSSANLQSGFETDYLIAWAKGTKAGTSTFEYNGNIYNTKGGKKI
ncbi:hypothetical protein MYP_646 [Sporocytophaga myxococcoides]|uniref:Uncharacterized protein n=1 Tax=Sporocytophaga myxococcoides TaxID=153721 RepID=A0A098LAG1_9BACT|nr:hypothetical protein [Sporocytophaga myxococcoides]GAL83419.1 hypothetical protein MYP_646 [Sporocytophaga myxococcoides]